MGVGQDHVVDIGRIEGEGLVELLRFQSLVDPAIDQNPFASAFQEIEASCYRATGAPES